MNDKSVMKMNSCTSPMSIKNLVNEKELATKSYI